MRAVVLGLMVGLGSCSDVVTAIGGSPDPVCASDATRAGLLQTIDEATTMFGKSPLQESGGPEEWEIVLSSIILDRYDRDTRRADCSAEAWIARYGAPRGVFLGRIQYAVKPMVGDGVQYELTGDEPQLVGIFIAVQNATGAKSP